ncbi:hypothetical protein H6F89_29545 [Cyanobacteria bacterium FACHB-63]|nr:hypothetical protein [Cyanobacteria bacterium FACHB-63]
MVKMMANFRKIVTHARSKTQQTRAKRREKTSRKALYDFPWTKERSLEQDLLISLQDAIASSREGGLDYEF